MNGLDKITGRITEDAKKRAQDILEDAQAQAQSVRENYARHGQDIRAELLAQAEEQVLSHIQRMKGAGELDGRKELLRVKQELLQAAFDRALEMLRAMPQTEYTAFLSDLLIQAAPQGKAEVIMNPADRSKVGKDVVTRANEALGAGLTLSEETRPIQGGFVVRSGLVEVNCALETLVEQEKEALYPQVAALLFPAG